MPKRTNPFQQLVHLIEHQLAAHEATVTESKEFTDQVTGEQREVDIVVERKVGAHSIAIGIECVDHSRPMDAPWIEKIYGKHRDLGGIHKTIVVSKSGFYKPALKKAKQRKIEAITLSEAKATDWVTHTRRLTKLKSLEVVSHGVRAVGDIRILVKPPGPPPYPPPPKLGKAGDHLVYDPSGKPIETVGNQVNRALNDPAFRDQIEQQVVPNTATTFDLKMDYFNGCYVIDHSGTKHLLATVVVTVEAQTDVSRIPLKRANYGSVSLLQGAGEHIGQPVQVAWTEQADGQMVLGARIGEPQIPASNKPQPRKNKQRGSG
jgi:hypothetical protein